MKNNKTAEEFFTLQEKFLYEEAEKLSEENIENINLKDNKSHLVLFQLLLDNSNSAIKQIRYNYSNKYIMANREEALFAIYKNNNEFFKDKNKFNKKLKNDLFNFYLERGNLNLALKIKGIPFYKKLYRIIVIPKLMISSLVGTMAILSSVELMQTVNNIYNGSAFGFFIFFILLLLNFLYFSIKDRDYLFPSIGFTKNLIRGLWAFLILLTYTSIIIYGIYYLNGFKSIISGKSPDITNLSLIPLIVTATFIGTFAHVITDKESSTKPI